MLSLIVTHSTRFEDRVLYFIVYFIFIYYYYYLGMIVGYTTHFTGFSLLVNSPASQNSSPNNGLDSNQKMTIIIVVCVVFVVVVITSVGSFRYRQNKKFATLSEVNELNEY